MNLNFIYIQYIVYLIGQPLYAKPDKNKTKKGKLTSFSYILLT